MPRLPGVMPTTSGGGDAADRPTSRTSPCSVEAATARSTRNASPCTPTAPAASPSPTPTGTPNPRNADRGSADPNGGSNPDRSDDPLGNTPDGRPDGHPHLDNCIAIGRAFDLAAASEAVGLRALGLFDDLVRCGRATG